MKFLVDECTRAAVVAALRKAGFELESVSNVISPGSPDEEVLQNARDRNWIVITEDKDFGELVYSLGLPATGVVLMRSAVTPADVRSLCTTLIGELRKNPDLFYEHVTVVQPNKIRRRPMPGSFEQASEDFQ